MKKLLLIINPSSGGERAKEYQELAKSKLTTFFDSIEIKYTKKSGDARSFARQAALEKYHSIFVMGGDGTVNEGISGLAELDYRPNFGFFPLGTVNDLARALKIPLNPKEAIENFDINRITKLDVGKINNTYFINVVAIGTIPESVNNVDSKDKTRLGKLAYFVSGAKELINTNFYDFEIIVDGQKQEIKTSTILIGLTNSIGGFESMFPKAKVDDGKLHIAYTKDSSLWDTLKAIPQIIQGIDSSSENIDYTTFSKAEVRLINSTDTLTLNIDGDEGETLPVSIEILPSHIKVYK